MLNIENSNKFASKTMKQDTFNNFEERSYTFKITKKRSPWTPEVRQVLKIFRKTML